VPVLAKIEQANIEERAAGYQSSAAIGALQFLLIGDDGVVEAEVARAASRSKYKPLKCKVSRMMLFGASCRRLAPRRQILVRP